MPGNINLSALPVGSNVLDRDNDEWTKVVNGRWKYVISHGDADTSAELGSYARSSAEMDEFAPFTMAQPDLFQQARIALRDRYGVEPSTDDVHSIVRGMDDNDYTAAEAITARENLRAILAAGPQPPSESQPAARYVDVTDLLDADFAVVVFVKDNGTAGLARLRAHAALDGLLDQHGISR